VAMQVSSLFCAFLPLDPVGATAASSALMHRKSLMMSDTTALQLTQVASRPTEILSKRRSSHQSFLSCRGGQCACCNGPALSDPRRAAPAQRSSISDPGQRWVDIVKRGRISHNAVLEPTGSDTTEPRGVLTTHMQHIMCARGSGRGLVSQAGHSDGRQQ